ncbi:MAG: hypothetical protein ABIJ59_02150 [Pseudomonadota bacterium]
MSEMYEELDFRHTPIGDPMLRRRRLIQLGGLDIYEVKLGEDFLMTSLFHEAEFALSCDVSKSFDPDSPAKEHDAILLDIDHTPTRVLHQTNTRFYTEQGLKELAQHLKPGGVFGLWADGFPENSFTNLLRKVFQSAESHIIEFDNPLTGGSSEGTVYVAQLSL